MTAAPTLRDVYRARKTIAPYVNRTPLVSAPWLGAHIDGSVSLKLETVQDIGAFKIRGATNRLQRLSAAERERGVVAVSTGNHGRAVASAAQRLGIPAVVCMSELVKPNKIDAIRALGAEVRIVGASQDDAEVEAMRLVREEQRIFVHPFDDPDVIAGQGTIGLELIEDMPDIDFVVAGLSGGGLLGGIALALKGICKDIRIIGVTMERGAAMIESIKAGAPVTVNELPTLADSLGGGIGLDNRYTFELVRDFIDDFVLVSEEQIAAAMRALYYQQRLVTEGAAAVGVAALMHGLIDGLAGCGVCVISGANVDMQTFASIVNVDGYGQVDTDRA